MKTFSEKVLDLTRRIPKGKVTTYGEIAKALKSKGYRAVGQALRKNERPVVIPCHRVVNSDGGLGGYSGGLEKKILLLKREGVEIKNGKINLEKYFWKLA